MEGGADSSSGYVVGSWTMVKRKLGVFLKTQMLLGGLETK